MQVDNDKLNEFVGRFVGDLGAVVHGGMVVIGERLGLYKGNWARPRRQWPFAHARQSEGGPCRTSLVLPLLRSRTNAGNLRGLSEQRPGRTP